MSLMDVHRLTFTVLHVMVQGQRQRKIKEATDWQC